MRRPGARIVHVGKRGGCTSTPQAFIERLMITAVHEGETVVRLKGGDPFIFGRGGEEVEHLREAGIEVARGQRHHRRPGRRHGARRAAHAPRPCAGRGVRHRPCQDRHGAASTRPTGAQLAATARDARLTLVIYMGVAGVAHIQDELLHGLPGDTPVAVIQHASLPQQRHIATTLARLRARHRGARPWPARR